MPLKRLQRARVCVCVVSKGNGPVDKDRMNSCDVVEGRAMFRPLPAGDAYFHAGRLTGCFSRCGRKQL